MHREIGLERIIFEALLASDTTGKKKYNNFHWQALYTGIPKEAIEMAIKDRLLGGNGKYWSILNVKVNWIPKQLLFELTLPLELIKQWFSEYAWLNVDYI